MQSLVVSNIDSYYIEGDNKNFILIRLYLKNCLIKFSSVYVSSFLILFLKKEIHEYTVIDLGIHLIQPQICNSLSNLYNVSKYKLTLTPCPPQPVGKGDWRSQ